MMQGRVLRIGLITGAVLLTAGIYFLPKKPQLKEDTEAKTEVTPESDFLFDKYVSDSKAKLPWSEGNKIDGWEKLLEANSTETSLYDSISKIWDANSLPGIAAWYYERKAGSSNAESDWLGSAYRYFDAFKAANDSIQSSYFVQQAIESYSKVIELNPANLDAKTDLGLLYAEGTGEPMKGIMMLREVVTTNPKHENAHLNLGFLSMKSGQYEKAIERFNKVLEINSARVDMYVYLGEAYIRTGNKEKAIENFEIFKNLSNDPQMISEVDNYIKAIKAK